MRYSLVLFDLDDTLLDFRKTQRAAFDATLNSFSIEGDRSALFGEYRAISGELWARYEAGQLAADQLRFERFRRLLEHARRSDIDTVEISESYLDQLPQHTFVIDGTVETCRQVASRAKLGVVTNGFESVQHRRLANSPLAEFVDFLLTSEAVGAPKPEPAIFERAMSLCDARPDSTAMIGDNVESDIRGANGLGIDAFWFNPGGADAAQTPPQARELRHLSAFLDHV